MSRSWRRLPFALLALLASAADGRSHTFVGTVTEQIEPGSDPLVSLGDTLTVRFDYDPATQPRGIDASVTDDPDVWLFGTGFQAYMDNGLSWVAAHEYSNGFVLLHDKPGVNPTFFAWLIPTGTATLPILRIWDTGFSIEPGGFYYGNTTPSLGFGGRLTRVPEPVTWGMMVAGFGLLGARVRASALKARARWT
jgi:hypothetical protein